MDEKVATGADVDPHSLLGDFETAMWLPRLRERACGRWSLRLAPAHAARGYWGRLYAISGMPLLTGPFEADAAAWMSIVPMEVESHEIGIASARGHTAVLGLGMGWCAANVALRDDVERVTIVERDPDTVALVEALGVFTQLPETVQAKIEIVSGDALAWRPDAPVDSLQIDIWAPLVAPNRWDEVRRIQAHVGAASLYFWGQELELWRLACRARRDIPRALEAGELAALAGSTGLPLALDPATDYPERIAEAARWWTPREDRWWAH